MKRKRSDCLELNWEVLDAMLSLGAELIDCRDKLQMSDDTIQRRIKEKTGLTFSEYRKEKMAGIRQRLRQKQIDVALKGNVTMLIWLGKQYLGQVEKIENDLSGDMKETIKLAYSLPKKDIA